MEDGRRFSGFINTQAEKESDFPVRITGTFWTEKTDQGVFGRYELDGGKLDRNYVIGALRPPKYVPLDASPTEMDKAFASTLSLGSWERIERRIEDCLVLEKTYVISL